MSDVTYTLLPKERALRSVFGERILSAMSVGANAQTEMFSVRLSFVFPVVNPVLVVESPERPDMEVLTHASSMLVDGALMDGLLTLEQHRKLRTTYRLVDTFGEGGTEQ